MRGESLQFLDRELGDAAPVVGVVDDGGEEVRGGEHRPAAVDPHGGRVVAEGTWREVAQTTGSVTGQFLSGMRQIAVPPRRTAIDVTTGTPSSADNRSRSISMPRRRAISIMLSASITGRPTCLSSRARRSASRRFEASPTQTIRSGLASLASRPSTTSRVISSSGERARSE